MSAPWKNAVSVPLKAKGIETAEKFNCRSQSLDHLTKELAS